MKNKSPDRQLAYSIRFYCMGPVGMTLEWALNDNITSAGTVVKMMFASMPENMRNVLFGGAVSQTRQENT